MDLEAAKAEVAEVAEAVEHALGRQRLAMARAEITDARAALAATRTEMAAPLADGVIHDIATADDDDVPGLFECTGDQQVLLASFETLAGDALRRQAWAAEEEAHSYAVAMARGYMCSDLDSLGRRGPSPAWAEHENRELADVIAARDDAVAAAGPLPRPDGSVAGG
ncbi:hypothetical protein QYE76_020519 [Lolium multiflorum]|uniref:Uncharacterized protein n=1 Tax=Lolium multiflorum TaxID=4521 RepID=A0AAD8VPA9_LOLMU|nr:hypothetical protein QYE76_020519 [Lolium multiflorum]